MKKKRDKLFNQEFDPQESYASGDQLFIWNFEPQVSISSTWINLSTRWRLVYDFQCKDGRFSECPQRSSWQARMEDRGYSGYSKKVPHMQFTAVAVSTHS